MAEELHSRTVHVDIENFKENFLECIVCNYEFDETAHVPRLLPCLHTFCSTCLKALKRDNKLECPMCRKEHILSDLSEMPKDLIRLNLKDFINVQRGSPLMSCNDCPEDSQAKFLCLVCHVFLCAECNKAHNRNHVTRDHTVLSFSELTTADKNVFHRNLMCSKHNQAYDFFCESEACRTPICTACTVCDHERAKGHALRNLQEVYEERKRQIGCKNDVLGKQLTCVNKSLNTLDSEIIQLETKQQSILKDINTSFDFCFNVLMRRRAELCEGVTRVCTGKSKVLREQRDILRNLHLSMKGAKDYCDKVTQQGNSLEFLHISDYMESRLNELNKTRIETQSHGKTHLEYLPENMGLAFEALTNQLGNLNVGNVHPAKTEVQVYYGIRGKPSVVMEIECFDYRGKKFTLGGDIVMVDIEDPEGNVTPVLVRDVVQDTGYYLVEFMPTLTGKHRAMVSVMNDNLAEEGFEFNVLSEEHSPGIRKEEERLLRSDAYRKKVKRPDFSFDCDAENCEIEVSEDRKIIWLKPGEEGGSIPFLRGDIGLLDAGVYCWSVLAKFTIVGTRDDIKNVNNSLVIGLSHMDPREMTEDNSNVSVRHSIRQSEGEYQTFIQCGASVERKVDTFLSSDDNRIRFTGWFVFILDTERRIVSVIDGKQKRLIHTFSSVDVSKPLWPVFEVHVRHPRQMSHELCLQIGEDIDNVLIK